MNDQPITSYIVLSEQSRHLPLFECLRTLIHGNWHFINKKDDFNTELINKINPRYIFIPHWSYKIAPEITKSFDCVMFHMTDLPFGRGGSPLQNLIVRGFTETKLSAFRCEDALDAGPIYCKAALSLVGTAEEIFLDADNLVVKLIFEIIQKNLSPIEQEGEITLFQRRTPEQGNIQKLSKLNEIYNYIRMLDADGYPNAYVDSEKFRLCLSNAKFENGKLTAEVAFKERKNVT